VAEQPFGRKDATEFIGDLFRIANTRASSLIDLCKSTAIIDEETDRIAASFSTQTRSVMANTRGRHC
jgi:hypothetical protein